jgi:hypothetical protein
VSEDRQVAIATDVIHSALRKLKKANEGSAHDITTLTAGEAAMLWRLFTEHGTPAFKALAERATGC